MEKLPPKIVTRVEARALGLKRYFTGEPCTRGHVCERATRNSDCVECNHERCRLWHLGPSKVVTRICIGCGAEYPTRRKTQRYCKLACAGANTEYKAQRECVVCGHSYTPTGGKQKTCPSAECKAALHKQWLDTTRTKRNERNRQWRLDNPDLARQFSREHAKKRRRENPEKYRAQQREYYAANIERERKRGREWMRVWYAANKEEVTRRERERRAADPEKYRAQARACHAANPEKRRLNDRLWRAENIQKVRNLRMDTHHVHMFAREILKSMGLLREEDTEREKRKLVTAYADMGLINYKEIREWLNTKTLKKA
jgi:hypothetical protein